MKTKGIFCVTTVVFLLLSNCEYDPVRRAIKTKSYKKGVECIDQVIDSLKMTKIVMEARNMEVSSYALEKLNNQELLAKVAGGQKLYPPEYAEIRIAALDKITDQLLLADILMSSDSMLNLSYSYKTRFYETAVMNLTDLNILSELLYKMETSYYERLGLERIYEILTGDVEEYLKFKNLGTKGVCFKTTEKLILSFKNVPRNDALRNLRRLLPAFGFLLLPEVLHEAGEVKSVDVRWRSVSAYYMGDFSGNKPGEQLTCTVRLQKIPGQFSKTWRSDFPRTVSSLSFLSARVNYQDLLDPVVEKLSDEVKQTYASYGK